MNPQGIKIIEGEMRTIDIGYPGTVFGQMQVDSHPMVHFDATPWFKSASDEVIAAMFVSEEMRADIYADIAEEISKYDLNVNRLLDRRGSGSSVVMQLDKENVLAWIRIKRPALQKKLSSKEALFLNQKSGPEGAMQR